MLNCFPQWLNHFGLPSVMHEGSNFTIVSSTLVIFQFSITAILVGMKWFLFDLHFPND